MAYLIGPKTLTPAQKVRLAHDAVFQRHPITLAAVAAKWKIIETDRADGRYLDTFCTNGRELRYNPKWAAQLTLAQVACVVLHEILHVALGHHFRLGRILGVGKNSRIDVVVADIANEAMDLAINGLAMEDYKAICPPDELAWLIRNGTFPRHGKFASQPAKKGFEYYFRELMAEHKAKQLAAKGYGDNDEEDEEDDEEDDASGGDGQDRLDDVLDEQTKNVGKDKAKAEGDGEGEGEGAGGGEGEGDGDGEGGEGKGKGKGEGGDGEGEGEGDGEGGSGQGDGAGEGETGNAFGRVTPYSLDEEEIEDGQKDFEQTVTAAIVTEKGWGTEGGWLCTELVRIVFPVDPDQERVNWRTELRNFLTKVCSQGYSYTRPSRRHGWRTDVILPAHRGRGNTDGLLIVDTSGSMGDDECNIALRELENVLSEFPKASVKLISCDTRVIEGKTYQRADFPLREVEAWKGRGGTDLSPAFRYAKDNARHFDWVVCLSDMEWWYQNAPNPEKPTIWLACRPLNYGAIPFGTAVRVKV